MVQAVSGLGHVFGAESLPARFRRAFVRQAYWLAFRHPRSRVIFQNPEDRRALSFALKEGQAALIPGSGADGALFRPQPCPAGPPLVVLAGRMLWAKGVGEFVEAARRLQGRGTFARFALVGAPDPGNPAAVPAEKLRAWAKEGVVAWWGQRGDMPEVFRQAAIVCLPTYYGEGIPKVLIEAAAAGRPIVTTDWPGCREIVRDGENGLLIPPRDAEALAQALSRLLEGEDLRQAMGQAGRQRFEEAFTEKHVVNATLDLYKVLATRKQSVQRGSFPGAWSP